MTVPADLLTDVDRWFPYRGPCFAGETRILTIEGSRSLKESAGTTQTVLTTDNHGGFLGTWVDAEIRSFGVAPLIAVELQRNKRSKTVYATADHRWLVRRRVRSRPKPQTIPVTTLELGRQKDTRLAYLFPRTRTKRWKGFVPSPFGIAHGVVYGDGSRKRDGCEVILYGSKDAQLLRYFAASRTKEVRAERNVPGILVRDLPAAFKDRPSLGESAAYLYGWLAGYFAADGSVSKQGQPKLSSARLDNLEFVRRVAHLLGIGTYGISTEARGGTISIVGQPPTDFTPLHSLVFVASTLTSAFFLIEEHHDRFNTRDDAYERLGWTVRSVTPTDRAEEVYCAVVPGTERFALEDNILVMNCGVCGLDDEVGARHRLIDSVAGAVAAGDSELSVAADFEVPVEAVRTAVAFAKAQRPNPLPARAARDGFSGLVDRVVGYGDRVTITRNGAPVAALVPHDDLVRLEQLDAADHDQPGTDQET